MLNEIIKKPAVEKKWLIFLSGAMWTSVGVLLIKIAINWFAELNNQQVLSAIFAGMILGILITSFVFNKVVNKNINRIFAYKENVCIFAFQEWRTYILIVIMMSMGIFMRTTSFIPKFLLAPMYIGIGFALFLSSLRYYKIFFYSDKD